MRNTLLFGGTSKERLVSVASAQALHQALPDADLWFWDVADTVHEVKSGQLLGHKRPFEDVFKPESRGVGLEQALDRAKLESRVLLLGCTAAGRRTASCRRCARCAGFPSPAPARLVVPGFDKVGAKRFAAIAGVKGARGRCGWTSFDAALPNTAS